MAKQQTLTLVVPDDMADPADLVKRSLERYLNRGITPVEFVENTGELDEDTIILIEEP